MKKIIVALSVLLMVVSCKTNKKNQTKTEVKQEVKQELKNNKNIDFIGVYKGVLPCASCSGIETKLIVNEDLTYELHQKYLEERETPVNVVKGKIILFEAKEPSEKVNRFMLNNEPKLEFVIEGKILSILSDGQKIKGELAENYKLVKQ